ncbi:MAG: hypothetical protein SGI92_03045 [Bryobacteraceae bacterium]|nr:hypothetical protein [Bryobacteraceae bacterium]
MKLNRYLAVALLSAALLPAADVQTALLRHSLNTSVTNRDVVVLAKSGFDEEFIIRVILGARCSCDVTADALAELAGQGITERIIEVMLDASYRAGTVVSPLPAAYPTTVPTVPVAGQMVGVPMMTPSASFGGDTITSGRLVRVPSPDGRLITTLESAKTSAVATAVTGRVPMFEAMSAFWGIWRKKSSVANAPDPRMAATLPTGMLVNGRWQYVSTPMAPVLYHGGLGRQWHTAPPAATTAPAAYYPANVYSPLVPPVYTHYVIGR